VRRCSFCHAGLEVVLWVFDGTSNCPVPACRSCTDERRLTVYRIDAYEGADLPERAICACCGRTLPCPETWPVIVWVRDRKGLNAVCNACRVEYALDTVFASLPRPRGEPPPRAS
jgi:hypothetical protein